MRLLPPFGRDPARLAFAAALLAGAALRLAGVFHDLPFSYFGDELHLTKRAMAMGGGDLNPHWFSKGALLLYVLLALYGTFYVVGHLAGRFPSPDAFGAYFLAEPAAFLLIGRLVVAACGIAMIWVTWRLAAKALADRAAAATAAAAVALLPPLVLGSQHLKEDVPMAALVLLGSWLLFRGERARDTAMAGAAGGLGIAVKISAAAVLPAMCCVELMRSRRARRPARRAAARCALLLGAALAASFAGSPYQYLDSSFARQLAGRAQEVAGDPAVEHYSPDSKVLFSHTPRWWARSAWPSRGWSRSGMRSDRRCSCSPRWGSPRPCGARRRARSHRSSPSPRSSSPGSR